MTVKQKAEPKKERALLTPIEQRCLRALVSISMHGNGRIPSLKEISEAMAEKRALSGVSRLMKSLEKKGYIRLRLQVVP